MDNDLKSQSTEMLLVFLGDLRNGAKNYLDKAELVIAELQEREKAKKEKAK